MAVGELAGTGTNAKMSEYHAAVGLASLKIGSGMQKDEGHCIVI
jgi:dTDP-4-amino-4,6-dideoxygalactose transaminase